MVALAEYRRKRNFRRTSEPAGHKGGTRKSGLRFVIQKHDASRLHYDFRLELDGVLKSWAVPKGPSLNPSKKSLAVQVEDHPIEYGDFEGTIPQGEYGGGTVMLWDTGTWEPVGDNPSEHLRAGKIHFKLEGEKLKGEWALVQMHGRFGGDGKNWLLMKVRDEYVDTRHDILKQDHSVKTNRSMDDIAAGKKGKAVWKSNRSKSQEGDGRSEPKKVVPPNGHRRRSPFAKEAIPKAVAPQLAVLADHPPKGDDWIHEIKFDGYRLIGFIDGRSARLHTRNGHDWTHRFPNLADALIDLDCQSAIVDGEAVILDAQGRSDFQALQAMLKREQSAKPVYYIFDLLFLNGEDLRDKPLLERKKKLKALLGKKHDGVLRYSDHTTGDGDAVAGKACEMGLEGVISKRADARYVSRRDPSWLKSKCGHRQEFVIIGFTDPQGGRQGFGSLLLGYHNDEGKLVYAGRVGTGFDDRFLNDLRSQLNKLKTAKAPTDMDPPARERKHAHWVKPTLVGEVRFTGWTEDGVLRHPAFIALRSDKPASQIRREDPVSPERVTRKGATTSRKAAKSDAPAKKSSARARTRATTSSPDKVEGVTLTHPDKILYPESGVTKRQIADYYEAAAEFLLPHVIHRPLALVRCPAGRGEKCFFQRNWTNALPDTIDPVDVGEKGKKETHVAVHDLAGVISLVQMGVLEIHTWNAPADDVELPDQLIFDLDPGPGVTWKQMIEAARILRKTLNGLNIDPFLKTSGGKGLHLTIPIKPNIGWDAAKGFCQTIAESLVEQREDLFVANMRKDLRGGKIYIDYHRNGRTATAVAPYSTRARDGAPVSMPVSWNELGRLKSAAHFTVGTARHYLERRKADPWKDFERSRIDLHEALSRASVD